MVLCKQNLNRGSFSRQKKLFEVIHDLYAFEILVHFQPKSMSLLIFRKWIDREKEFRNQDTKELYRNFSPLDFVTTSYILFQKKKKNRLIFDNHLKLLDIASYKNTSWISYFASSYSIYLTANKENEIDVLKLSEF